MDVASHVLRIRQFCCPNIYFDSRRSVKLVWKANLQDWKWT